MFFHYLTLSFIEINTLSRIESFKLSKIVILKTFVSNIRVLFWERYIRFDYKQWKTCSETFSRTLKYKVSLDPWSIISEFISGPKNEKT